MLYCIGAKLALIGWLCGKEPINSVAVPVSMYGRGIFLAIRLAVFDTSSGSYVIIWVGRTDWSTDVS